jgi:hypothetical protein
LKTACRNIRAQLPLEPHIEARDHSNRNWMLDCP